MENLPPARIRPVPAVSRAIAILRLLSRNDKPLGVNAIARELHLVPSTCLHILRVLVQEEFLAVNPATRQYRLEAGVLTIAREFLVRDSFRSMVQPILDQLADKFGLTVVGMQVTRLSQVAIAVSRSTHPVRIHVEIGSSSPPLIGAAGRCVAAYGGYKRGELARRFPALHWYHAPTLKQWLGQVEFTRKSGYSVDEGNYFHGLTAVGVPILDEHGLISHAVVAVGVSAQIAKTGTAKLAAQMQKEVVRLSRADTRSPL
jgi:DNA-binding IclR family transcriptional regulator